MKKVIVMAIAIVVIFASCGHKSNNLIGDFKVIKKIKTSKYYDRGALIMASKLKDTIRVNVDLEEHYLQVRINDILPVRKDEFNNLVLSQRKRRGVVGDSRVIEKYSYHQKVYCRVITRGGDTIVAQVNEVIYYNVSVNDKIFVKKNRGIKKGQPKYYVE